MWYRATSPRACRRCRRHTGKVLRYALALPSTLRVLRTLRGSTLRVLRTLAAEVRVRVLRTLARKVKCCAMR